MLKTFPSLAAIAITAMPLLAALPALAERIPLWFAGSDRRANTQYFVDERYVKYDGDLVLLKVNIMNEHYDPSVVTVMAIDCRSRQFFLGGQEIMTGDRGASPIQTIQRGSVADTIYGHYCLF